MKSILISLVFISVTLAAMPERVYSKVVFSYRTEYANDAVEAKLKAMLYSGPQKLDSKTG